MDIEDAKEVTAKHRRLFQQQDYPPSTSRSNRPNRCSRTKYPTVAITTLNVQDVQQSLCLELDVEDTEMEAIQPLPLPSYLIRTLSLIKKASGSSKINEASTRWVIDAIILEAYEEATRDLKNAQPLSVQCERNYQVGPVVLNHKKVILSGRPDYSVWGQTRLPNYSDIWHGSRFVRREFLGLQAAVVFTTMAWYGRGIDQGQSL
ncbi:hypothetical protein N7466_005948 [Penicillium verhagenii]|uniref:uncharacterized protein n=1 Tax=Penicillium verhagenii TaxID=1562060 RepID=UPI0025455253|nr:uncharacterized protein N7466_005948 [Penicillium verhagenii]KAJ5930455.1 hypothetical protein N7466_005948 [Penicillium verhagenii]